MLTSNSPPAAPPGSAFDPESGGRVERAIFNHRALALTLFVLVSVLLGWSALHLKMNASFDRMIPQSHPYIKNYFDNKSELRSLGNSIRIVVENTQGTIYDADFLKALQDLTNIAYLAPGAQRAYVKSISMPIVRWTEVTEDGFRSAPVMPANFDGSAAAIEQVRVNVDRANIVGSLVARDYRSAMIVVPLLELDAETGQPLDYGKLKAYLDEQLRAKYEPGRVGAGAEGGKIRLHVVGFAELVGQLMQGLSQMALYFCVSVLITAVLIYLYTRCVRSTLLILFAAALAVVWQLGLIQLLGFEIDPYSILVPFLVFVIGVSHGSQKMNGIMQDIGRGTGKYVAARHTFRRLFVAGLTALLANVVGFAVLIIIDIPVIKSIAISASIGVATLIFTKLILVPVVLSYTGVSERAAARSVRGGAEAAGLAARFWDFVCTFTRRDRAIRMLVVSALIGAASFAASLHVKIGDVDPGAPELRPGSAYNRDVAFVNLQFGLSSDQFAVIGKTPRDACGVYETLIEAERLSWSLRQLEGVQATSSLADSIPWVIAGSQEGDPKWASINRSAGLLNPALNTIATYNPELLNKDCTVFPVIAYLSDHKAETLARVVAEVEAFGAAHDVPERRFLLAAGSAGIEAVTNIVVQKANRELLMIVYLSVIVCCYATFRSWRAVIVALIPLLITSALCEALMVALGMGIKVATLPVIAVGVGVGVDYALYLLSVQLALQRQGKSLAEAYRGAVMFTGRVVALIGFTMAAGIVTWVASPIKFQADMGLLLTFMFLWNMIGALFMIPALSAFLLQGEGRLGVAAHESAPWRPDAQQRLNIDNSVD